MALAQYLCNKDYFKFFYEKKQKGDTVILDNGAYEESAIHFSELARWVTELRPSVVVLPDVPGNFEKTIQRSHNYLDSFGLPHGTEGMMVLHAKDGALAHFEVAYNLCPVKWIGFSRLTKRYSGDPGYLRRVHFAKWLKEQSVWRSDLTHHALGMLNGEVAELRHLALAGFHSCDSSAPIWRGLHGYTLTDTDWPNFEFDPTGIGDPELLAEVNLTQVLEACNG